MRLATKLALAVVLVMAAVFAFRAHESVQRELRRGRADLQEGQFIIGRALRPPIREVWRLEGRQRALQVLDIADERIQRARQVKISWVPFDPLPRWHAAVIGSKDLDRMKRSDDVTIVRETDEHLFTYVPVLVHRQVEGALVISDPITALEERSRAEVRAVMIRAGMGAAVSILAVSALGFMLIGRPMRRLAEFAKRIGGGDLDGRLSVRQRDEVGELANEMNQMCRRLQLASERLREETHARIGALEQLRHADRLRTVGTLASGIAHELGTPLNVVSGRAKMVASGEVEGVDAAASCRIIVEQVERMVKIIRQLLDFARRRTPDRGLRSLATVAEETLALLRPMAGKRRIELRLELVDPQLSANIDAGQVQQALMNLVVNAIHAMPGGGEVTMAIGRTSTSRPPDLGGTPGEFAEITVADGGSGIPRDLLARVFEPFFTTKDVGEGTGLGLSVAYGIVRDHGGWIAVSSEPGRGSRFSVYLPLEHDAQEVE